MIANIANCEYRQLCSRLPAAPSYKQGVPAPGIRMRPAALHFNFEPDASHEFLKGRIGGRRPNGQAAPGPQGGAGQMQSFVIVQTMVAAGAQSGRTVIDVKNDAVEAAPGFANYVANVFLQNDYAWICQCTSGKIEGRVSIPCNDRRQYL